MCIKQSEHLKAAETLPTLVTHVRFSTKANLHSFLS